MSIDEFFVAEVCELGVAHPPSLSGVCVVLLNLLFVFEVELDSIPAFVLIVDFPVFGLEIVKLLVQIAVSLSLEDG